MQAGTHGDGCGHLNVRQQVCCVGFVGPLPSQHDVAAAARGGLTERGEKCVSELGSWQQGVAGNRAGAAWHYTRARAEERLRAAAGGTCKLSRSPSSSSLWLPAACNLPATQPPAPPEQDDVHLSLLDGNRQLGLVGDAKGGRRGRRGRARRRRRVGRRGRRAGRQRGRRRWRRPATAQWERQRHEDCGGLVLLVCKHLMRRRKAEELPVCHGTGPPQPSLPVV